MATVYDCSNESELLEGLRAARGAIGRYQGCQQQHRGSQGHTKSCGAGGGAKSQPYERSGQRL